MIDKSKLLSSSSMIDLIGRTPLMRLDGLCKQGAATIWAKCEQYNPGGSIKDRVALAMIERAEEEGLLVPGKSTVVEPTSGNTGIGLALVCSAKGYPLILTMPESMSLERRALLKSYGATIILTPAPEAMAGSVKKAQELVDSNDHHYMPNQFDNPANPASHRATTGKELIDQMAGDEVHAFVSAIGTGGTITGIGGLLLEKYPTCEVVGVEPETSAVIAGGVAGPHKIQGIGAGFVPKNLDRSCITQLRTVTDRQAYDMSQRLAKSLGLLVGISSGANVHVAAALAAELGEGKNVVTVLCDTGERYFSLDEHFRQDQPKSSDD